VACFYLLKGQAQLPVTDGIMEVLHFIANYITAEPRGETRGNAKFLEVTTHFVQSALVARKILRLKEARQKQQLVKAGRYCCLPKKSNFQPFLLN